MWTWVRDLVTVVLISWVRAEVMVMGWLVVAAWRWEVRREVVVWARRGTLKWERGSKMRIVLFRPGRGVVDMLVGRMAWAVRR
jgi:hypothetical protein